MQGKLVFNQSRSTFLFLYRFSKMAVPVVFVEWKAFYLQKAKERTRPPAPYRLFICSG